MFAGVRYLAYVFCMIALQFVSEASYVAPFRQFDNISAPGSSHRMPLAATRKPPVDPKTKALSSLRRQSTLAKPPQTERGSLAATRGDVTSSKPPVDPKTKAPSSLRRQSTLAKPPQTERGSLAATRGDVTSSKPPVDPKTKAPSSLRRESTTHEEITTAVFPRRSASRTRKKPVGEAILPASANDEILLVMNLFPDGVRPKVVEMLSQVASLSSDSVMLLEVIRTMLVAGVQEFRHQGAQIDAVETKVDKVDDRLRHLESQLSFQQRVVQPVSNAPVFSIMKDSGDTSEVSIIADKLIYIGPIQDSQPYGEGRLNFIGLPRIVSISGHFNGGVLSFGERITVGVEGEDLIVIAPADSGSFDFLMPEIMQEIAALQYVTVSSNSDNVRISGSGFMLDFSPQKTYIGRIDGFSKPTEGILVEGGKFQFKTF